MGGWLSGGGGRYYLRLVITHEIHACRMAVWPHLHTTATHGTVVDNWPYGNQRVEILPGHSSSGTITAVKTDF